MSRSTREGARARRNRTRAKITTAAALTTVAAAAIGATPASAVITEPEVAPHIYTVFPDRDFISVEGYNPGEPLVARVVRNGVTIGSAEGTANDEGIFEVNHPGGACWTGTTPNIIAHDRVIVAKPGDLDKPDPVGEATTAADVRATAVEPEVDALGAPTGRLIVRGTARAADGTPLGLDVVEQRIVNPALTGTSVAKRDVRATVDDGNLQADPVVAGGFIATYDFRGRADASAINRAILAGQTRVLSWQAFVNGERQGITIHEVGEVGGPGFGGCPGAANYAVTGSNHPAVTKAMKDAGTSLIVHGVAQDATAVTASLTDGATVANSALVTVDAATSTWSAEFTAAQVAGLTDGTLTASGQYTVPGGAQPIAGVGLDIAKDTIAPGAPGATPPGGRYSTAQSVSLLSPDLAAAIHYTLDGTTPSAANRVAPAQLSITSSQSIRAIVVDRVGNSSTVSQFDYVIDSGGGAAAAIPGAGAATPSQGVLPSSARSLAVSRLSLARRISITRLRVQGLRASMTLPQGTNVVRIAVYKARNGRRTGSALFTSTRAPRAAGLYRVTLKNASLLRKLKAGSYVMEAQVGRSAGSLGRATAITFKVNR